MKTGAGPGIVRAYGAVAATSRGSRAAPGSTRGGHRLWSDRKMRGTGFETPPFRWTLAKSRHTRERAL